MTDIRLGVLGPLQCEVDGRPVELGGAKPRTLLAALVANRNQPVSSGALIEALWDEEAPATAAKSIQKYVSGLRKTLGETLVTSPGGYRLVIDEAMVDAGIFTSLVAAARDADEAEELLEEALALWRGEPYPELADTEIGPGESANLGELRLEAEEMLIESRLASGRHAEIIGHIEELVSEHPYRERRWSQLMRALYRSGRQSEALAAYRRLRQTLGEELGIEPSQELQDLEERILLHDPTLDPSVEIPTNLPAALTSFVGRIDEMDRISDLLGSARLITLLGPAGSGKTRLALETGTAHMSAFGHGVWFIDLAPVRSPDQVVDAIAAPLGVGGSGERPTESVLAEYVAGRRLLLIVDNCEHLVARVAEVLSRLLHAGPEVAVLTTSRERLGVDGEIIFDVPPLPYPDVDAEPSEEFDAVRLFMERARAVDADFDLTADRAAVGEIVRRLDGIPLAIELAAARVRTLGMTELRDRLDNRFSLLASPSRAPLERHQTLRAAVEWSYRLLNSDERTLFNRLSVFRGGFDLEAAAQVCGYAPLSQDEVSELVGDLVDKSLVAISAKSPGRRRFFMLETLREFGQAALDSSETSPLRDAHALYFCRLAERAAEHLSGPDQAKWFSVIGADHDNMRKALRWAATTDPDTAVRLAVALAKYWDSMGPRAEGHEWLQRAVDLSLHLDPVRRIEALLAASMIFSSSHASLPQSYSREALAIARESGDELGEARALRSLSWALALDERPDEAIACGLEALSVFEEGDDPWDLALCLERLGQAGYHDPAWSVEMLERAHRIYGEVGDRTREALTLYKMADRLAHALGNVDKAKTYAERAVRMCEELGNLNDAAHAKLEYGKILRRAGEPERAGLILSEALQQLTRSGDERCSVRALTATGTSLLDAGDYEDAAETLRESLRRGRELGEKHTTRVALAGLARVMIETGREGKAVVLLAFVDRLGGELAVPVSEQSKARREARLATIRERTGPDEFDRLWKMGVAMDIDAVTEIALGAPVG